MSTLEVHNPYDWYIWVYAGVTVILGLMTLCLILQVRHLQATQDATLSLTRQALSWQRDADRTFQDTIREVAELKRKAG